MNKIPFRCFYLQYSLFHHGAEVYALHRKKCCVEKKCSNRLRHGPRQDTTACLESGRSRAPVVQRGSSVRSKAMTSSSSWVCNLWTRDRVAECLAKMVAFGQTIARPRQERCSVPEWKIWSERKSSRFGSHATGGLCVPSFRKSYDRNYSFPLHSGNLWKFGQGHCRERQKAVII